MGYILQLHDVPTPGPKVSEHRSSRRKGYSPLTPGLPAPGLCMCSAPSRREHLQLILPELTWGLFLVRLRVSGWYGSGDLRSSGKRPPTLYYRCVCMVVFLKTTILTRCSPTCEHLDTDACLNLGSIAPRNFSVCHQWD